MTFRFGEDYLILRPTGRSEKGEHAYGDDARRRDAIAFQVEYYLEEYGRSGLMWDDLLWSDELPGLIEDLRRFLEGSRRRVFFLNRYNTFVLWAEEEEGKCVLRLRIGERPNIILWTHTTDRESLLSLYTELEELSEAYPSA